jgi:hypothetical protein
MRRAASTSSRPGTVACAPLAEALDQPQAETPLEFADLQADRRLGQVEPPRRCREAPLLDHLEEGAQLVEVEAAQPKFSL